MISLYLFLFLSWKLIEWKTYDKTNYGYEALNVDAEDDEDFPITKQIKTPPPPLPPAPEIIEIVEDEEEVEETVTESTETDQEEIIKEVEVMYDMLDEVSFAIIEEVPTFPGCGKLGKSEHRQCFQDRTDRHVR